MNLHKLIAIKKNDNDSKSLEITKMLKIFINYVGITTILLIIIHSLMKFEYLNLRNIITTHVSF